MFQIRHRDESIFRCTYEICSRINRDFGYVCERSCTAPKSAACVT
jgi:hypothetical protein